MVIIEMENGKQIKLELYPDKAPITVENFLKLVSAGFYDGLIFHRVIKDFMIQGGDPEGTGMGGAKEKIKGEFLMNGVPNDLRHERGVISMARAQNPNSASSQFFICHKDSFFLDGQHTARPGRRSPCGRSSSATRTPSSWTGSMLRSAELSTAWTRLTRSQRFRLITATDLSPSAK